MPTQPNQYIIPRPPQMEMGGKAVWFNEYGHKIEVDPEYRNGVRLSSNATEVIIAREDQNQFTVYYRITQTEGRTETWLLFSKDDLEAAFGVTPKCRAMFGQHIVDKYGGDAAQQGKFIKFEDQLNIPGPGTGEQGDPNISIKLSGPILAAVEQFLFQD